MVPWWGWRLAGLTVLGAFQHTPQPAPERPDPAEGQSVDMLRRENGQLLRDATCSSSRGRTCEAAPRGGPEGNWRPPGPAAAGTTRLAAAGAGQGQASTHSQSDYPAPSTYSSTHLLSHPPNHSPSIHPSVYPPTYHPPSIYASVHLPPAYPPPRIHVIT